MKPRGTLRTSQQLAEYYWVIPVDTTWNKRVAQLSPAWIPSLRNWDRIKTVVVLSSCYSFSATSLISLCLSISIHTPFSEFLLVEGQDCTEQGTRISTSTHHVVSQITEARAHPSPCQRSGFWISKARSLAHFLIYFLLCLPFPEGQEWWRALLAKLA